MVYSKQSWVNTPSVLSPLNAARLNHMETQYDEAVVTAAADAAAADAAVASAVLAEVAIDLEAKAPVASPTFTGTVAGVTKSMVGLGNVDNTTDLGKPISTTTQTALDLKAADGGLPRGKTATNYKIVACCLRRIDATTWGALEDAAHSATNVTSVARMVDRVRVTYDFTAGKVVTFAATLDEAFAAWTGLLRVGASVGTTYADLYFYTSGSAGAPIDPGTLSTAGANVWVYGLFEVA